MAAGAGLLLAASFPKLGVAGLGWIAPGLILLCGLGLAPGERFRVGYVAGLAHYLVSLYWLLYIPYRWHGIPLAPITGWLALSAFMALYLGGWVWLVGGWLQPERAADAPVGAGPWQLLARQTWARRAVLALFAAAVWVAMEMVIARFLSGFPWNLLGCSQFRLIPLLQIASVTGVYGVSFLMVWTSVCLAAALARVLHSPRARPGFAVELVLPALVLALVFGFGFRGSLRPDAGPTLRMVLIQPSIPQTLIWDPANDEVRFRELLGLSRQAATNGARLVIWPEAAVPKLLRYDQETFDAITGFAQSNQLWMIIGADDAEPRGAKDPRTGRQQADYFNSSFLIGPGGRPAATYKKRALVIFGEYVPLARWLSFLKFFTPIEGGFTPGEKPVHFRMTDPEVQCSVLICFEDIFPHLAREYVTEDTDFLVNLTNNGWFGEGAAQWQHAAAAVFRAVENGRSLVRCSNNGLTCWVDRHGRLREIFADAQGSVYGQGAMVLDLPFHDRVPGQTFYNRHGDLFGWGCVGLTLLVLVVRRRGTVR